LQQLAWLMAAAMTKVALAMLPLLLPSLLVAPVTPTAI
jgi:hypothetical protein